LILGERALTPKSNAAGKFYIVTDGKTHPDGNQVSCVYVWESHMTCALLI